MQTSPFPPPPPSTISTGPSLICCTLPVEAVAAVVVPAPRAGAASVYRGFAADTSVVVDALNELKTSKHFARYKNSVT